MQASGVLIHQLLLRKVKSQNPAELKFFIGDSNLRFGLGKFALITALNFAKDLDVVKYKSMSSSMRLRETYLNNAANVRSGELEAESSTKIMMDMLSFVENDEDFFNYPWERIALQYWASEAIPKLTGAFSGNLGIKFPRMLSWTSNKTPSMMDCIDVFKIKKVSPEN
ncbi:hypothetical protein PanWU01x14_065170 [Parasponia andersonii]|uniref:DUF1985 domain-containing protein n=1 Tax=Parasponia andersonii TaxID=3476 RepID=A0A2P5DGP3_PARAD|nr:hypothetical protein PanWU01x14_065170 [Parasponia andersonii]